MHNLELEAQYEEYRSVAFGELEDLKFHGTSDEGVEGITRDGFRIGKPGMYGAGIYFATDSSKSSQAIYTKGSNKLLLCKVFLGQAKTVSKADSSLTASRKPVKIQYLFCCFCQEIKDTFSICSKM